MNFYDNATEVHLAAESLCEFAFQFLEYAAIIKNYADNECVAIIDDLQDKFRK